MLIAKDHVDAIHSPASSEDQFIPADPEPDDVSDSTGDLSPQQDHPLTDNDDITYDHGAAHRAALVPHHEAREESQTASANDAMQSSSTSDDRDRPSAPSTARQSFYDEEYVQGRRVPSPPNEIDIDFEPPEEIYQLQVEITGILANAGWLPDFKAARIPSLQRDAATHRELYALLYQRGKTENELNALYYDEAHDGTLLDPKRDIEGDYNRRNPGRDFETDYQRLNTLYNGLNRRMFTLFLTYLKDPARSQRKRKAEEMALTAITHILPSDDTNGEASNDSIPPCPYVHIAKLPTPPLASPQLEYIACTKEGNRALLSHTVPSPYTNSVSAIADSGASHVLLRQSDSHILSETEFSSSKPYAVLTAANNATINAIGRGTLTVQTISITA